MTSMLSTIAVSLTLGLAAGGAVWFGWALVQNLATAFASSKGSIPSDATTPRLSRLNRLPRDEACPRGCPSFTSRLTSSARLRTCCSPRSRLQEGSAVSPRAPLHNAFLRLDFGER